MRVIEEVYRLCNEFMKDPKYVTINEDRCKSLANKIKEEKFSIQYNVPEAALNKDFIYSIVKTELFLDSINYCYWYGTSYIRPSQASATNLQKLIQSNLFSLNELVEVLTIERYPLLEERIKHLTEVWTSCETFILKIIERNKQDINITYDLFENLIIKYPGYGSDMFLKRASLFFVNLYRTFGWFEPFIKELFVPADYRLPQVLNYLGCLEYENELENIIDNHILIPKHSRMECEIRSATILACKKISELNGVLIPFIDQWLWTYSKAIHTYFHLTETTDY